MKTSIKIFVAIWKENFRFRTLFSSAVSSVIGLIFIIFNGVLGVVYSSLWHGTICIYYIFLTIVRVIIVFGLRKEEYRHETNAVSFRIRVSKITHCLLLVVNLSLIVPISIMVHGDRNYEYGLIPAIAMAAYTTYRIVISIINLKKAKKQSNCLIREVRVINMIDTLVSILTLQNALIIANGGMGSEMKTLATYSSAGIFALIVFVTVRSMIVNRQETLNFGITGKTNRFLKKR